MRQNEAILYGKVPPQAIDMERAVLGAVMTERTAMGRIEGILSPDVFYVDAHVRIFEAFKDMSNRNRAIDVLTTVEHLKASGNLDVVGGHYYLTKLTDDVYQTASLEGYALKIVEKWKQRELIRIGGQMVNMGYDDQYQSDDILGEAERAITAVSSTGMDDRISHINNVMVDVWKDTNELIQKRKDLEDRGIDSGIITGIPTGFKELNRITNGWESESLIILAARPAMGKTALALNFARNAAINDLKPVNVGLFSMEMSSRQLVQRMISSESGVFLENIKKGKLSEHYQRQMFESGMRPLSETGIYFDDTPGLRITQLKSKARMMVRVFKVGLIVIDYIQLMSGETPGRGNREQEISTISRNLKGLAKELRIPIIALSQLSREVEKRSDKKPQLSDLRESGAIEQDADMVMFLYRPEYYDIRANADGESTQGLSIVSVAKHRSGETGDVRLEANLGIQKFSDWNGVPVATEGAWKRIEAKTDLTPF